MKWVLSGLFGAALVVVFSPGGSYARDCTGLTYPELIERLRALEFPIILLGKVHVDDKELRTQKHFVDCPPRSAEGETAYIYSWRPIDDTKGLGVSFTFFEFSDVETRERTLRKQIAADDRVQDAIGASDHVTTNKLESDVYYYVDPASTKAFRVERDVQFVIE